tara:strand:- start:122 stop:1021 length:900 start_codon:yes stop_codon:yes gene_type:complete
MAETNTFTVDTTTQTETMSDNLTADEQDSLAVGEKIVEGQQQLLAGKYKNAEELEKAYVELQQKLGKSSKDEVKTEDETETKAVKNESEVLEKAYNENGSVNYETVSETFGSQLSGLLEKADVDPWAISKQFHESQGQYTTEMVNSLVKAGLSEQAVKAYFAGRAAEEGYTTNGPTPAEITTAEINEIKNSAGGDKAYADIVNWAKSNLDQKQIDAFDEVINTGSVQAIRLAVSGLKSEYNNANGVEGRMVTGKTAPKNADVFRSQAELVQAMSDRRYDNDPAYRQDVIEKLDRSDLNF